jgi:hypothetical protein
MKVTSKIQTYKGFLGNVLLLLEKKILTLLRLGRSNLQTRPENFRDQTAQIRPKRTFPSSRSVTRIFVMYVQGHFLNAILCSNAGILDAIYSYFGLVKLVISE